MNIEKNGVVTIHALDKNYFHNLAGALNEKGTMLKSLLKDKKKERE